MNILLSLIAFPSHVNIWTRPSSFRMPCQLMKRAFPCTQSPPYVRICEASVNNNVMNIISLTFMMILQFQYDTKEKWSCHRQYVSVNTSLIYYSPHVRALYVMLYSQACYVMVVCCIRLVRRAVALRVGRFHQSANKHICQLFISGFPRVFVKFVNL